MLSLIRVELTKLRKRRMTWILLGIMVSIFVLMAVVNYVIANNPMEHLTPEMIEARKENLILPLSMNEVYSITQGIGSLLLIILVGAAVGNEYGWGTIRQVLTRKGVRYQYVTAKLIAFVIYAVIGILIAFIIGFVMSMITTAVLDGGIDWSFMDSIFVGDFFRYYGWTLYTLIPYILLTLTFALLGRSALVGIGATLGYTFFVEGIFIGLLGLGNETIAKIGHYFIGTNVSVLLPQIEADGPMGGFSAAVDPPTTAWAVVTLAIYSVVLLGISLWLFKKRDITA